MGGFSGKKLSCPYRTISSLLDDLTGVTFPRRYPAGPGVAGVLGGLLVVTGAPFFFFLLWSFPALMGVPLFVLLVLDALALRS